MTTKTKKTNMTVICNGYVIECMESAKCALIASVSQPDLPEILRNGTWESTARLEDILAAADYKVEDKKIIAVNEYGQPIAVLEPEVMQKQTSIAMHTVRLLLRQPPIITIEGLHEHMDWLESAACDDGQTFRYALQYIGFQSFDGQTYAIASDGRRLHAVPVQLSGSEPERPILIHAKTLATMLKLAKKKSKSPTIGVSFITASVDQENVEQQPQTTGGLLIVVAAKDTLFVAQQNEASKFPDCTGLLEGAKNSMNNKSNRVSTPTAAEMKALAQSPIRFVCGTYTAEKLHLVQFVKQSKAIVRGDSATTPNAWSPYSLCVQFQYLKDLLGKEPEQWELYTDKEIDPEMLNGINKTLQRTAIIMGCRADKPTIAQWRYDRYVFPNGTFSTDGVMWQDKNGRDVSPDTYMLVGGPQDGRIVERQ